MWFASPTVCTRGFPLLILLYYIHPHSLYSTIQWTVNSPQSLNTTPFIWMRIVLMIWSRLHAHPQSTQMTGNTQLMMALAGEAVTIMLWMAVCMKFPMHTLQLPMKCKDKHIYKQNMPNQTLYYIEVYWYIASPLIYLHSIYIVIVYYYSCAYTHNQYI